MIMAAMYVLIILLCLVRFLMVEQQGLWLDELYTVALINGLDLYLFPGSDLTHQTNLLPANYYRELLTASTFLENFERNIVHEGHPPVYYLLIAIWSATFGYTEGALRSFSVFASCLTIPVVYFIARTGYDRLTSLYAATIFASLPIQTYFALEARSYTLAVLLVALATLCFLNILRSPRSGLRYRLAWVVFGFLAIMSHYYALLYLSALLLCFFFVRFYDPPSRFLSTDATYLLLPYFLFLAWVPVLVRQTQIHGDSHWTQGAVSLFESALATLSSITELVIGPGIFPASAAANLVVFVLLAFSIRYFLKNRRPLRVLDRVLFSSVLAFYVGVIALDFLLDKKTITVSRYAIFNCLPISILLARALWGGPGSRLVGGLVVLALSATSLSIAKGELVPKQMVRESVHFVETHRVPNAAIIVSPSGPLLAGFGIYGAEETPVKGVSPRRIDQSIADLLHEGYEEVWVIEQRLGLETEAWRLRDRLEPKGVTRFVGIDVKQYQQ